MTVLQRTVGRTVGLSWQNKTPRYTFKTKHTTHSISDEHVSLNNVGYELYFRGAGPVKENQISAFDYYRAPKYGCSCQYNISIVTGATKLFFAESSFGGVILPRLSCGRLIFCL